MEGVADIFGMMNFHQDDEISVFGVFAPYELVLVHLYPKKKRLKIVIGIEIEFSMFKIQISFQMNRLKRDLRIPISISTTISIFRNGYSGRKMGF